MVTSLVVRSNGSVGLHADAWHYSVQDNLERMRFTPSGSTVFKGHSTTSFEFFNASNQRVSYIDSFGNTAFTGSASFAYGLFISDLSSPSNQWLLYKNVGDSQLYLRDLVNSRMQVTYLPGPNLDNSQTTFNTRVHVGLGGNDPFSVYSRFIAAGSDATAWGVNVENTGNGQAFITLQRTGTTPIRWYKYIPGASTDLRYYANAADRFTFRDDGTFIATAGVRATHYVANESDGYRSVNGDRLQTMGSGLPWQLLTNSGSALGLKVGSLVISNDYADTTFTNGLFVKGPVTTASLISSATEFRLNNNTFSRVAQIDGAGGFGGGYNFNITGGTNRDSTGNVAGYYYTQNRIKFYAETTGAPGPINPRAEVHSGGLDVLGLDQAKLDRGPLRFF